MDGSKFDGLTRSMAGGASRRSVLRGIVGGVAGLTVLSRGAGAQLTNCEIQCAESGSQCCTTGDGPFCAAPDAVCCGGGTCQSSQTCCRNSDCCPSTGYYCDDELGCCQNQECTPGQCGDNFSSYCGNTEVFYTCGCFQGQVCESGVCVSAVCESDGDCEDDACCCETGDCSVDCCEPIPEPECETDSDCDGKDVCCCKDGTCGIDCCGSDGGETDGGKPDGGSGGHGSGGGGKPASPPPDLQLPNTGSGDDSNHTSLIAGIAVAAGAAAVVGSKLKSSEQNQTN